MASASSGTSSSAEEERGPPAGTTPSASETEETALSPEEIFEEEEEIALGGTPAGQATNEMLRALSRAARSFLIYDPRNEAIRGFLQRYQETSNEALSDFGEVNLEIRPFEMVRGAEIVYLERDRERSLAFRMFRDGVRKLSITPDVTWEELLRLLEILSIRFTGIRQQEDDIVTLLLKAGFKNIDITAVEGFVPDEEEYCGDDISASAARTARKRRQNESHIDVPPDWDLPMPVFEGSEEELDALPELSYRSVSEERLAHFAEESSSRMLTENTVKLLIGMLRVVADPTDPTAPEDIDGLINETRDFLLSEGQLNAVLDLVRQAQPILANDPEQSEAVLGSFTNERAIRRIIQTLPKSVEQAPPDLIELLDLSPINHLPVLLEILSIERREASRRVVRELIGRYIDGNIPKVIEFVQFAEASIAADLMRAVSDADPSKRLNLIRSVEVRTEPEIRFQALHIIEQIDNMTEVKDYLERLLKDNLEDVRRRALGLLLNTNDRELFPTLEQMLKRGGSLSNEEAIAIGEAMGALHPSRARMVFTEWVKPKKWFSVGNVGVSKSLQFAAIAGLGRVPGEPVLKLIKDFKEQTSADLADFCNKTLVLRRRLGIDQQTGEGQ